MAANRLLILDDDARVLEILAEAGRRSRYEVTPTDSFGQFRDLFEAGAPTLMVLDLQYQGGDGSELISFLQERGCGVPIILVSGPDSRALGLARRVREAGGLPIVGTLITPFPAAALTALLEARREPDLDEWAGEIRAAIEEGQLGVHYLPVAEVRSGRVVGFEALARWFHPRRGLISPDRFIPLAEATGLISPLTDYVLARAIATCANWAAAGFDLSVAVNVAGPSLTSVQILEEIGRLLQDHHLPASRLTLEVSEATAMRQPELTTEVLARLRERGVSISLDDFGTGFSNLRILSQMPFTELKIDRSFVADVVDNRKNQRIAQAIAALATSLGMTLVAEGVESIHVLRWLSMIGVEQYQGYLIARPMPSDRVLDWLRAYAPPR